MRTAVLALAAATLALAPLALAGHDGTRLAWRNPEAPVQLVTGSWCGELECPAVIVYPVDAVAFTSPASCPAVGACSLAGSVELRYGAFSPFFVDVRSGTYTVAPTLDACAEASAPFCAGVEGLVVALRTDDGFVDLAGSGAIASAGVLRAARDLALEGTVGAREYRFVAE